MIVLSRREVLLGGLGTAAAFAGGFGAAARANSADHVLTVSRLDHEIMPGKPTVGMMSFSPDGPPPVLRLKQGREATIDVVNMLDEASVVHWHGLRISNAMDGVPYLTQNPIEPGETFRYRFTPPDAGTFWYHPHCNTLEQISRGLTGALIVEEETDPGFDADLPLNIRDFRLGGDGQFIEFFKPRNAARGGTIGTVSTVNWQDNPVYDLPSGGLVRLRLVVSDVTRLGSFGIDGAEGRIIAIDSNPVPELMPLSDVILSPGQRVDCAVLMPEDEGRDVRVLLRRPNGDRVLARLRSNGPSLNRHLGDLKPLPANPVAAPDLKNAEVLDFVFGWSPEGNAPQASICGSLGYTFWSINRIAWQGDNPGHLEPLAVLKQGKTYILRLRNETPNDHPIHLHGVTFQLLSSNKRDVPPLYTDTALLLSEETMEVALVADNPGDWAFHCHVIEHQKTGLTGFVRIEA